MGNFWGVSLPQTTGKPKVILITGASSGMGFEMAMTMIQRGHVVYGAARRVAKLQALVDAGGHALEMDVTNEKKVKQCVSKIVKEQGRTDVLVNNAGAAFVGAAEEVPVQEFRNLFEVNFFGVVHLTQQVIPYMREHGGGLIVNISSISGKVHRAFHATYVSAKHALEGWSDCLRVEMERWKIKVVVFEPGLVKSEIFDKTPIYVPPKSLYKAAIEAYNENYAPYIQKASPPSVIAEYLVQVVDGTAQLRRRYVMGYMGYTMIAIKTLLGDSFIDKLIKKILDKAKELSN